MITLLTQQLQLILVLVLESIRTAVTGYMRVFSQLVMFQEATATVILFVLYITTAVMMLQLNVHQVSYHLNYVPLS